MFIFVLYNILYMLNFFYTDSNKESVGATIWYYNTCAQIVVITLSYNSYMLTIVQGLLALAAC